MLEEYRSGHNGAVSKTAVVARLTWVQIPPPPPMTQKEIERIVFDHRPVLKTLLDENGSLSIHDYYKKEIPSFQTREDRKKELIATIGQKVADILGEETAESVASDLFKNYFCSTADHHQPLTHPFFSNANLAQSIANRRKGLKNILVLACSNVSLNNSSYPRGIFYHDRNLKEVRLPFFSLKNRHHPVFKLPTYKKEGLKKIPGEIKDVFLNEKVLASKTYSDQITQINFALWKKVPGECDANLIYLNQEEIVSNLILNHHLSEPTLINQLLINPSFQKSFAKNFENILGAFSTENRKGTFLFWGLKDGQRVSLSAENSSFSSDSSLRKALQNREIFPSMALSFIVLSFYYGLPCGGGFSQINYLTEMKTAYLKLLAETNSPKEEIAAVEKTPTDIFRGEFIFTLIKNWQNTLPATLIDLILYPKPDTAQTIDDLAKGVKLENAVSYMFPEFYKIITGQKVALENLPQIPCAIHV